MSEIRDITDAVEKLRNEGWLFEVVMADSYTLTIDLDTKEAIEKFDERLETLQKYLSCRKLDEWPSKRKGKHVRVALDEQMDVQSRAVMQAFLGSDPTREMLGYFDTRSGQEPFCLFKPIVWSEKKA
jgi:hypothetical protein